MTNLSVKHMVYRAGSARRATPFPSIHKTAQIRHCNTIGDLPQPPLPPSAILLPLPLLRWLAVQQHRAEAAAEAVVEARPGPKQQHHVDSRLHTACSPSFRGGSRRGDEGALCMASTMPSTPLSPHTPYMGLRAGAAPEPEPSDACLAGTGL